MSTLFDFSSDLEVDLSQRVFSMISSEAGPNLTGLWKFSQSSRQKKYFRSTWTKRYCTISASLILEILIMPPGYRKYFFKVYWQLGDSSWRKCQLGEVLVRRLTKKINAWSATITAPFSDSQPVIKIYQNITKHYIFSMNFS